MREKGRGTHLIQTELNVVLQPLELFRVLFPSDGLVDGVAESL